MRQLVDSLVELDPVKKTLAAAQINGAWELVYTTVELFRASPFFQMVMIGPSFSIYDVLCFCVPGGEGNRMRPVRDNSTIPA